MARDTRVVTPKCNAPLSFTSSLPFPATYYVMKDMMRLHSSSSYWWDSVPKSKDACVRSTFCFETQSGSVSYAETLRTRWTLVGDAVVKIWFDFTLYLCCLLMVELQLNWFCWFAIRFFKSAMVCLLSLYIISDLYIVEVLIHIYI